MKDRELRRLNGFVGNNFRMCDALIIPNRFAAGQEVSWFAVARFESVIIIFDFWLPKAPGSYKTTNLSWAESGEPQSAASCVFCSWPEVLFSIHRIQECTHSLTRPARGNPSRVMCCWPIQGGATGRKPMPMTRDKKMQIFRGETHLGPHETRFYLEASGWELTKALDEWRAEVRWEAEQVRGGILHSAGTPLGSSVFVIVHKASSLVENMKC